MDDDKNENIEANKNEVPLRLRRAETVLSFRTKSLAVIFERPTDAFNINAAMRNLEGFCIEN